MDGPRLEVLLLCDFDPFNAQMIADHIYALAQGSRHKVHVLSFRGTLDEALELARFDVVVIHYTTFIYLDAYIAPSARSRIAAFAGVKAVFLQDEYKHVNRTKAALAEIGATIVFTCFGADAAAQVYGDLAGLVLISVLPGYVSPALREIDPGPATSSRAIDIGYRGRRYPAWHGRLGLERLIIAERVVRDGNQHGLVLDISVDEQDRIYGRRWLAFQRRCKAVLGTESGASVIDFTGEIALQVEAHLQREPLTSHDVLRQLYFSNTDERIPYRTISPRIFEAIACRAALILYEGDYADLLTPGRHYLPLRRDHGNFDEIVRFLKDARSLDGLTERARTEVLLAPKAQQQALLDVFDLALLRQVPIPTTIGYSRAEFEVHFGRYDSRWRKPVIKRQIFKICYNSYRSVSRWLPSAATRELDTVLTRAWREYSRR